MKKYGITDDMTIAAAAMLHIKDIKVLADKLGLPFETVIDSWRHHCSEVIEEVLLTEEANRNDRQEKKKCHLSLIKADDSAS